MDDNLNNDDQKWLLKHYGN